MLFTVYRIVRKITKSYWYCQNEKIYQDLAVPKLEGFCQGLVENST